MRYVSSLNADVVCDARTVLTEVRASDGGLFCPQPVPTLLQQQLQELLELPFWPCVSRVLARFFPVSGLEEKLTLPEPEQISLRERIVVCCLWDRRTGSLEGLRESVLSAMEAKALGSGSWPALAVDIALLFGLYGQAVRRGLLTAGEPLHLAAAGGDFSVPAACVYAEAMGLPVRSVICACSDNGPWELLHRGELRQDKPLEEAERVLAPELERIVHRSLGQDYAAVFHGIRTDGGACTVPEELRAKLQGVLSVSVVSPERARDLIRQIYRSSDYLLSPESAMAYGGITASRAMTGDRQTVLLLAGESPLRAGSEVLSALGIKKENLLTQIRQLEQAAQARREEQ